MQPSDALRVWSAGEFRVHFQRVEDFVTGVGREAALISAYEWARVDDPTYLALSLNILGEVTFQLRWTPEMVSIAERGARSDDVDVRWSVGAALRYSEIEKVYPFLLKLLDDEDVGVRFQAIIAVSGAEHFDPLTRAAVVRAMNDADEDVRSWATFAFRLFAGREAHDLQLLQDRLAEGFNDVAGEAAVGLAERGAPGIVATLLERLSDENTSNLFVQAAAKSGDPILLPALVALRASGWEEWDALPEDLEKAIVACSSDGAERTAQK